MIDNPNLTDRQKTQAMDYQSIVEVYGKFDQSTGANGAHYAPADKNPFQAEGLICSNCVFFEGGQACEIVDGQIDPNAVCKMWIIPENLLTASNKEQKSMKLNFSMSVSAADTNKREISGRVVTWGEQGNTSAGPTVFAKESLKFNKTTKLLLEHDRTRPIGKLMGYTITEDGIDATFKIANTMAGEDALVEASDGLRDGFSVGVAVDKWVNEDGVMRIDNARVQEVSLVTDPAIDSARVSDVAASEDNTVPTEADVNKNSESTDSDVKSEGDQVSDTTDQVATPAVEPVEVASEVTASKPVAYTSLRSPIVDGASFVEHSIKAAKGDHESAMYVAAANDTSSNTGLTLPTHMAEFITTDIGGRAAVDAISGPQALPATGLSFTIPVITQAPSFDAPVAELDAPTVDEVESNYMTVDIKKAMTSQKVSWELIDRSGPAFYAELLALLSKAYARKTDAIVVDAIINNANAATAQTADADGLQKFVSVESAAIYGDTGSFAQNLLVNSSQWANIMGYQDSAKRPLYTASNPVNNPGAASGSSLSGSILGTNLFVDAHIASGTGNNSMFLIAPDAATFYEGPRTQLQIQNLADGSLSVALYNYYAVAIKKAAGIKRFILD